MSLSSITLLLASVFWTTWDQKAKEKRLDTYFAISLKNF
jgi:hypothetical protein